MPLQRAKRASQNYHISSSDFIPIACHYDNETLVTKNGELIQIIQINGINAQHVSETLFNLREMVRNAIQKHITDNNFTFWIHTVRSKTNLDDPTPYDKLFAANVHDIWKRKNYWDDKFVNTLYISIVYSGSNVKTNSISKFFNSLSIAKISKFEQEYHMRVFKQLNDTVSNIMHDLSEYGVSKLGMRHDGDNVYSEMILLYYRILHLHDAYCLVPVNDLSISLSSYQYALGNDVIEVKDANSVKFAQLLSVNEYQEISADALDSFLQLPTELVATEIFHFVNQTDVIPKFKKQHYIATVSKDQKLLDINGINSIVNSDNTGDGKFCYQQISLSIIGDDLQQVKANLASTSRELSKLGIAHIKEDIMLEHAFWSQLPGNFSLLRRMTPTILRNTAALASLHNSPTGSDQSPWGRAVTLLRTENGTPYFMNFHTQDNKNCNFIFGIQNSGKTILTNFLISESTKFNPNILYFSDNNDSQIFIEALEGQWADAPKQKVVNPFLCDDNKENRDFINEFLKIICNHYHVSLSAKELEFISQLTRDIFAIEKSNRNIAYILKHLKFTTTESKKVHQLLKVFDAGGKYQGLFDADSLLPKHNVLGFNLSYFVQDQSICVGLIYAISQCFNMRSNKAPQMLAIDNMHNLCNFGKFFDLISSMLESVQKLNGVVLANYDIYSLERLDVTIREKVLNLIDITMILPSDSEITGLRHILQLSSAESRKISTIEVHSRMFLIRKQGQSIIVELSIGGFTGITKILSSREAELKQYKEILDKYPGHPDNWVIPLHQLFADES